MSDKIGDKSFNVSDFQPPPPSEPDATAVAKKNAGLNTETTSFQKAPPKLTIPYPAAPILSGAYRTVVPDCPSYLLDPHDPKNNAKYRDLIKALVSVMGFTKLEELHACFDQIWRDLEEERKGREEGSDDSDSGKDQEGKKEGKQEQKK